MPKLDEDKCHKDKRDMKRKRKYTWKKLINTEVFSET